MKLDRMYFTYSYLKIKTNFSKHLCQEGLISIIMHNLCVFYTFSTFVQKIFKGWGWNFTRSFVKVMCSKSMKILFVASIISHWLCMIFAFFYFFVQKSFLTKNYFFIAEKNLTTQGPLHTCLVFPHSLQLCYIWA